MFELQKNGVHLKKTIFLPKIFGELNYSLLLRPPEHSAKCNNHTTAPLHHLYTIFMKNKFFIIALLAQLFSLNMTASVIIGEIFYNLNAEKHQAEVTSSPLKYKGVVMIPDVVSFEGQDYKVTKIANFSFWHNTEVTSIVLPDGLTDIGNNAFAHCYGLTTITIPSTVEMIGHSAFWACNSMTSMVISEGVKTIGCYAFNGCNNLTSVTLPSTITSIGSEAFQGCDLLKDVYSLALTPPVTGENFFSAKLIKGMTLHVQSSALNDYSGNDSWNGFGTICTIEELPSMKICATPTIKYSNGQLIFECETEGVTFVSDITVSDSKTYNTSVVDLSATYNISVYAICEGYRNSLVKTATICWLDMEPKMESTLGNSTGMFEVNSTAALIYHEGDELVVSGVAEGTPITVYDLSGRNLGTGTAQAGTTRISAKTSEHILVVRVGNRSIKINK